MKIRFKSSIQLRKLVGLSLLVCGLQLSGTQAATFIPLVDPQGSVYTQPQAINPTGVITGYYNDSSGFSHGFVAGPPYGTITTFDAPGPNPPNPNSTYPTAINLTGVITGVYLDASFVDHGFLRASNGQITTIDYPLPVPPGSPPCSLRLSP